MKQMALLPSYFVFVFCMLCKRIHGKNKKLHVDFVGYSMLKEFFLYIYDFLCVGILEFRRGGTRPYIKIGGGEGTGTRDRRPPRIQQQMYVPPAQRK